MALNTLRIKASAALKSGASLSAGGVMDSSFLVQYIRGHTVCERHGPYKRDTTTTLVSRCGCKTDFEIRDKANSQ